jgi:hypothetical protein
MLDAVCSLCVHLYVIDEVRSLPRRCPRCREPLPVVYRETLTHLRQTQGRSPCASRGYPAPAAPAARESFRAILTTRPEAPWIPHVALETLTALLVSAVDRAARGHPDEGYTGLIDGLRAAEASGAAGAPWGPALTRCCREVLDLYTGCYAVRPEEEGPREEPPLPEEPRLLGAPPLALMDLEEQAAVAGRTS